MRIEWSHDFSVGVEEIDRQHKELWFFRKKVEMRIKGHDKSREKGIQEQSIEFLPYLV